MKQRLHKIWYNDNGINSTRSPGNQTISWDCGLCGFRLHFALSSTNTALKKPNGPLARILLQFFISVNPSNVTAINDSSGKSPRYYFTLVIESLTCVENSTTTTVISSVWEINEKKAEIPTSVSIFLQVTQINFSPTLQRSPESNITK